MTDNRRQAASTHERVRIQKGDETSRRDSGGGSGRTFESFGDTGAERVRSLVDLSMTLLGRHEQAISANPAQQVAKDVARATMIGPVVGVLNRGLIVPRAPLVTVFCNHLPVDSVNSSHLVAMLVRRHAFQRLPAETG